MKRTIHYNYDTKNTNWITNRGVIIEEDHVKKCKTLNKCNY